MKINRNILAFGLLFLCVLGWTSCGGDDHFSIVDPAHKTFEIACGQDFEIPVHSLSWQVESVKTVPEGELLTDRQGRPIALEGNGKVEASDGWLALSRDKADALTIHLKENFDRSAPRQFVICLNNNGRRDYIIVTQKAAQAYRLVKTEYREIAEEREIYRNNEGCSTITLENPTSETIWRPYGYIFKDVVESSTFESDDYEAFGWTGQEELELTMPDLLIDEAIRWNGQCLYKQGATTRPYLTPNDSKVKLPPYATYSFKGEITYCKRRCYYTFTIENQESGTEFEIRGIWTQIVPIVNHTILTDKP